MKNFNEYVIEGNREDNIFGYIVSGNFNDVNSALSPYKGTIVLEYDDEDGINYYVWKISSKLFPGYIFETQEDAHQAVIEADKSILSFLVERTDYQIHSYEMNNSVTKEILPIEIFN